MLPMMRNSTSDRKPGTTSGYSVMIGRNSRSMMLTKRCMRHTWRLCRMLCRFCSCLGGSGGATALKYRRNSSRSLTPAKLWLLIGGIFRSVTGTSHEKVSTGSAFHTL
ncbi:hypothetical protein DQ04_11641000 [Trypanosoma grayi]|uniref:hypothetical protein n=1 Tax=Trypanosoma grayi TaxID=71804 RepID=UPI0004F44F8B|nr:hypothetical protein DQ04_11641000 [Trypanosoma grayi]KEG06922.1 hypothetical protein DQ04_11641000 [Trypanosoma grayi]